MRCLCFWWKLQDRDDVCNSQLHAVRISGTASSLAETSRQVEGTQHDSVGHDVGIVEVNMN